MTMELGGKSPFIVFEDADLDSAVEGVVDAIWFNQGQVCCAGSRLLVQESIEKKFIQKLKKRMEKLRVGDPLDKSIDIGAIVAPVQLKKINSLVNVAGFTERGTILSTTLDNYNRNFNINTKAPFLLMQESIKVMIREKIHGTILNVLSMAMDSGMPFLTAYSGSKAALAIITKNVANGVSGHRIRVNALNIGWTDTPGEDTIQKKFHEGGEDWLEKAEAKVPFKRLTKPIDVARAAAYFCSEESGIVTGSIIDYDQTVNGWHSYSAYETSILDDSLLGE